MNAGPGSRLAQMAKEMLAQAPSQRNGDFPFACAFSEPTKSHIMGRNQASRKLYNPFRGTEYLERGGYGYIFRLINTDIALKIPHRMTNSAPDEDARTVESLKVLRREKAVYEILGRSPHPNIVQYFLGTDLAIFIKFEPDTLEKRLRRRFEVPIPEARQFRWVAEIARATSW